MAISTIVTAAPVHHLDLGFNVGYLTDSQYYATALHRLRIDADSSLKSLRFMGPFLHSNGSAASRRETFTAGWLHNISVIAGPDISLVLSLSDYPFDVQPDFLQSPSRYIDAWAGMPSTARLADTLTYTNRAPPTRGAWIDAGISDYVDVLKKLRVQVPSNVGFEIGNEPNALLYFWGTADDFLPLASATVHALGDEQLPLPPPYVLCCGFATELSAQGLGPTDNGHNADGWYHLAQTITAQQKAAAADRFPTALSWHFYRRSRGDFNLNRSTYANASAFYGESLNGSHITEWGLSSYNSHERAAEINSPALVLELVRLLTFSADVGIASVHFHCFMDNPKKPGHDCYIDRYGSPRISYMYLTLVGRLVGGGYTVEGGGDSGLLTRIVGVSNKMALVAAAGNLDGHRLVGRNFSLGPTDGVVASSGFAFDGKYLPAGEWLLLQTEP
jgi:hypothetical protein